MAAHVYVVMHQKGTLPLKGFRIGFCMEGVTIFHGVDLSEVVVKGVVWRPIVRFLRGAMIPRNKGKTHGLYENLSKLESII